MKYHAFKKSSHCNRVGGQAIPETGLDPVRRKQREFSYLRRKSFDRNHGKLSAQTKSHDTKFMNIFLLQKQKHDLFPISFFHRASAVPITVSMKEQVERVKRMGVFQYFFPLVEGVSILAKTVKKN